MDKIAIISDIHGNIPALQAVFEDISQRDIQHIICLGDITGKGPNSDKAIDMVEARCTHIVKGNWDYIISEPQLAVPGWLQLPWYRRQLGEHRLSYIRTLPLYIELTMSGRLLRLSHASPHDIFHKTFLTSPRHERLMLFAPPQPLGKTADIIGYGDIHVAHIDSFDDKTIFNVGSVGNPFETTQSSYAILEGGMGVQTLSPLTISLVRVPYDIDKAIDDALVTDMPFKEDYIKELTTGVYRGHVKKVIEKPGA